MTREYFVELCNRIETYVGLDNFKSKQYLHQLCVGIISEKKNNMIDDAHQKSISGFLSGKVKLALNFHILYGGSYIDLALLYEAKFTYSYKKFHCVIENWINDDRLVNSSGDDI